jgi:hypothetical protein
VTAALRDVNWQASWRMPYARSMRTAWVSMICGASNAIDAHVELEQGHTDHVSIASGVRRDPWANGTRASSELLRAGRQGPA